MSSTAQDTVDYANEAQMRVVADTRILIKKTTLAVTAGTAEYPLADDVIMLRS
jgi:NCAIR mutase (PurE)-related protein